MRILLDENLPWKLGPLLTGHAFSTVGRMGWAGIKNGKLLTLAQTEFDIFLTMDQGIPFQQSVGKYNIAVFLIYAPSNSLRDLRPFVATTLIAAQQPKKRSLTIIKN